MVCAVPCDARDRAWARNTAGRVLVPHDEDVCGGRCRGSPGAGGSVAARGRKAFRAGKAQASTWPPGQTHPRRVQNTQHGPRAGSDTSQEQWVDGRERDADQRERDADQRELVDDQREQIADQREQDADQRERDANLRETRLDNLARTLGQAVPGWQAHAREAVARSRAKVARSREAIERSQAALRREETREQRRRARARREFDALASEMAHILRERERERRETTRRTQAAREQARRLRSIARDTAERAARTRSDTRAAWQQASVAIRSDDHGQARAEGATVPAALTAEDGALSLRARPSSQPRSSGHMKAPIPKLADWPDTVH